MKIVRDHDLIIREIAGESFLIPVGEAANRFNGMITLNGMSAFIWKSLENEITKEELVNMIMDEYEADKAEVVQDVDAFLAQMEKLQMISYK